MRRLVGLFVLIPAVLMAGCATQDWVRQLLGKKEVAIDQRFGKVEGQAGEAATRLDRVEGRIGSEARRVDGLGGRVSGLETSVGETGEVARQARGRADAAFGRAEEVDGRLTRLWKSRHTRTLVETINVQFGFDRADLSDAAQTALLAVIKELRENPNLSVDLEGFTDATGAHGYNLELSRRRVEAVQRYLVENGTDLTRIHGIGLGPLPEAGAAPERARQRRVTVRLMVTAD